MTKLYVIDSMTGVSKGETVHKDNKGMTPHNFPITALGQKNRGLRGKL